MEGREIDWLSWIESAAPGVVLPAAEGEPHPPSLSDSKTAFRLAGEAVDQSMMDGRRRCGTGGSGGGWSPRRIRPVWMWCGGDGELSSFPRLPEIGQTMRIRGARGASFTSVA